MTQKAEKAIGVFCLASSNVLLSPCSFLPSRSVPGKYACGLWGLSPASRKRYDAAAAYGHDAAASATSQWAAPASSLWSSSSMAAAAAAASTTPSAQQQYGFQHPLAMAAK